MSAENLKALVEKGNLINLNIVSDSLANLLNEVATMLVDQQKQINQLKKEIADRCLQTEVDSFKEQYRADKGTIMRTFPTIESKFAQVNNDLQTTKEELKVYIDNSLANTLLGIDNRIFQRTETILNEQQMISQNISSLDLKVQDLTKKQLESKENVQEYATFEDMNKIQKRIQKADEQILALAQKQKEICIATNSIAGQVKNIGRRQLENSQLQYNSNQTKENQTNASKELNKNAVQQSDSSQTSNRSSVHAGTQQEQNSNSKQTKDNATTESVTNNSSNPEQINDNSTQKQNDSTKIEINEESNQNSNQETENSENKTELNVEERKIEIDNLASKEQNQSETSSVTSFRSTENVYQNADELQQNIENLSQVETNSLDQISENSSLNQQNLHSNTNRKTVSMHIVHAPVQKSEQLSNTQSEDADSDFLSDFTFNQGIDEKRFESFKSDVNQQINQIQQQIKHIYSETETIKEIQANQQKIQEEPNKNEQIIFGELDQIKAEIVQIEDVIEDQNKEIISRIERKSEISLVERMFEKLRLLIASVRDDITVVKKRIEVFVEKREMEEYVQGIIKNLLEEEHASFTNKPVKCLACGRARLNPSQLEIQTQPSTNSKDRNSELPALKFTIPRV